MTERPKLEVAWQQSSAVEQAAFVDTFMHELMGLIDAAHESTARRERECFLRHLTATAEAGDPVALKLLQKIEKRLTQRFS